MKARRILSVYFLLEEKLTSIPSVAGSRLERLRDRFFPSPQYNNYGEQLQIALADLSIFVKNLTPEEMQVCRLRYSRHVGIRTYEKFVPISEVHRMDFPDHTSEMLTKNSEELIANATTLDGEVIEGWVTVRGKASQRMRLDEIAKELNLTKKQVSVFLYRAHDKIHQALQKKRKENKHNEER